MIEGVTEEELENLGLDYYESDDTASPEVVS